MSMTMIVTDAGRAALINAAGNGTAPVTISHFGISAAAVTPLPASTALPGEIKRIGTIAGATTANDTIHLIVRDASADVYTMRSWALSLTDGTLFGLFGQPDPILSKTATSIMMEAIDIRFADIDATSLTFGDTNFLNPAATIEMQGVVELATNAETIAGTDDQRAVTPKSLAALHTAANVLAKLLTVDGSGSGLDSDFLRGLTPDGVVSGARVLAALGYTPANGNGNVGNVDLNIVVQSGMYRFDQPTNGPAGVAWGQLLVVHGSSDQVSQIAWETNTGRMHTRIGTPAVVGGSGIWSPWRLVVDAAHLAAASYGVNGSSMSRNGQHLYGPDNLTNLKQLANGPGYINTDGRAFGRKADGQAWNLIWAGQGAAPSHLLGSSNGLDFYAYSPGLLSVGYANNAGWAGSAGNADTVDGYHASDFAHLTAFESGSNANGSWYKIPLASGKAIIRQRGRRSTGWGSYTGEFQETVYFPTPYQTDQAAFVTLGQHGNDSGSDGYVQLKGVYKDRFIIQHQHPSSGNLNYGWDWMAEGEV